MNVSSEDHIIPNELDEETQKKYINEYLEIFKSIYSRIGDPTEAEMKRRAEINKYVNVTITHKFSNGVEVNLPLIL